MVSLCDRFGSRKRTSSIRLAWSGSIEYLGRAILEVSSTPYATNNELSGRPKFALNALSQAALPTCFRIVMINGSIRL